jgi:hypothetical protein
MGPRAQRIAPHIPLAKYANVPAYTPSPRLQVVEPDRSAELRQARKIDQANGVMDQCEAASAALAAEIKALQKRKAAIDARYTKIEERIIREMQAGGFEKCHGKKTAFELRNAPLALQVADESQVPQEYLREKLATSVDKVALKAAIIKGLEISGCSLTQKVSLIRK